MVIETGNHLFLPFRKVFTMSAFVCTDAHINAIATFAALHNVYINHGITHLQGAADAETIAGLLYTANVESVNTRYSKDDDSSTFKFVRVTKGEYLEPVQIMKLCICFDYQACEVENYEMSIACAITSAVVKDAARQLTAYRSASYSI
jgi:hypothetical protein